MAEYATSVTLEKNRAALDARIKDDVDKSLTAEKALLSLESADPTKKKAFTLQLLRWYIDGSMRYIEDATKATEALVLYSKFRNRGLSALNTLTFSQFLDLGDELGETKSRSDARSEETQSYMVNGDADLYYEDSKVKIVIPRTKEASCYFGRGTRWCTAETDNNRFDQYDRAGPLYVIMFKGEPSKWQFHFETKSFLDEKDESLTRDDKEKLFYLINGPFADKSHIIIEQYAKMLSYTGHVSTPNGHRNYTDGSLNSVDDQPAVVDGDKRIWYRNGVIHRDGGPALIDSNDEIWYQNGDIHRDDGPAIISHNDGSEQWLRNGKLHREDGPAIIAFGKEHWYRNGVRHRDDGPAIVKLRGGEGSYYLNGQKVDKSDVISNP